MAGMKCVNLNFTPFQKWKVIFTKLNLRLTWSSPLTQNAGENFGAMLEGNHEEVVSLCCDRIFSRNSVDTCTIMRFTCESLLQQRQLPTICASSSLFHIWLYSNRNCDLLRKTRSGLLQLHTMGCEMTYLHTPEAKAAIALLSKPNRLLECPATAIWLY